MSDSLDLLTGRGAQRLTSWSVALSDMRALRERLLQDIRRAALNGRCGKMRRRVLAYLNSEAACLSAACRAAGAGVTENAIWALAQSINPFERTLEEVQWHLQRKRSRGGFRVVCTLPLRLKAQHYLIKDVIEAIYQPPPHIFDIPGRGRDTAARAVKAALEAGYKHCFLGDVRDCYQHVSVGSLAALLPLPRLVIENCLNPRNLTLTESCATSCTSIYSAQRTRADGPRGLLQGSPASNIILAMLFGSLAQRIDPHDCRLINVSDNFIVAAKDNSTLEVIIALLREYLHEHPAGPFELKSSAQKVQPDAGFEFLGYWFEPKRNGVQIGVSDNRLWEFERELEAATAIDIQNDDTSAPAATNLIRNFFGGYRAMSNWELARQELFVGAVDEVVYAGVSGCYVQ